MNLETITNTLNVMSTNAETGLRSKLAEIAGKSSQDTTDMIDLQATMSRYTLSMETESTVVKAWADAIRGVIQKSGN